MMSYHVAEESNARAIFHANKWAKGERSRKGRSCAGDVPERVRRQLAIMSAERGESIRAVVLRALGEIGIRVPKEQLVNRRRRRQSEGKSNGSV